MNAGAPFSDHAKLLEDSTAPGSPEWSGASEGTGVGEVPPKVDGTDTVPASLGGGVGVGVSVEISCGGEGVSVGLGDCPNAASATSDAVKANPINVVRMVGNES